MSDFEERMIFKRTQFHEKVHAAFILDTSLNMWQKPSEANLLWLLSAYPKSEVKTGIDQGGRYYTITPKF